MWSSYFGHVVVAGLFMLSLFFKNSGSFGIGYLICVKCG